MSSRDDPFFDGALLAEFEPTPTAAWHERLAADLGDDWREQLRAGGEHDLLPFYRADDLADRPIGVPGAEPGWVVCHDVAAHRPEEARRGIERALGGGAGALGLPAPLLKATDDLGALLGDGAGAASPPLHLDGSPADARALLHAADAPGGSLVFDPAALHFAGRGAGRGADDPEARYRRLAALLKDAEQRAPAFRLVTANARPFHDAGAGAVESLALALAAMSEHFARLTDEGVPASTVAAHARMALPVGTRFFAEVARLRAARRLFATLAEAYGAPAEGHDYAPRLSLHAETAWRPVTLYDPHLNLLRGATAGALAAALGGADTLSVRPFDAAQREPGAFGARLALNAQHILREEAHLGRVADPAAGSYYAEVLTDRFARRAWRHFQEIEAGGGLLEALRRGSVQERLASARANRAEAMNRRGHVRVGTNQYPNLGEERLGNATEPGRTPPREADAFERLRLATERHATIEGQAWPTAFLLPVGTPKVRSARANFARNALGCAGFRVIENVGFDTAEAGVQAAARAVQRGRAHLVVCCAPDEAYATLVPAVRKARGDTGVPIVVAGEPSALPPEPRRTASAFLHRGMNLLETLEGLQERLGIAPPSR